MEVFFGLKREPPATFEEVFNLQTGTLLTIFDWGCVCVCIENNTQINKRAHKKRSETMLRQMDCC